MKKRTLITIISVIFLGLFSGCTESYSSPGSHVTHHHRSNTPNQDLIRSVNSLAGNSVNSERYRDSMSSAAVLDALSNLGF